jgi:poly(beta-D-mannuronate) lyase
MRNTKQLLLACCCMLLTCFAMAGTIVVKNMQELNNANAQAKPGDVIILENGEWNNAVMVLTCSGTKEQPITFKARTAGKVLVTGNSKLKLGGNYIIVDGLYFTKGYAGNDAVIDFKVSKNQLANNCRVTNCAVNDFNNARRMDENNWVLFSGKNNRLDHCSFINKKNMGVLLAVLLDDDRSRENFHSIDNNYFGLRIPLASNGGEIIRVGVSQHCEFNSNTSIKENFFEHCDGETEIISIKSGSNEVNGNLFKECQGSVVLRHGNNNKVENNTFLGNNKEGTGGVRVINRGQRVVFNSFYQCRGVDFRSPLAVMNGVPNSPAHRYVQVTDAFIDRNTFYECSPISLCEGSDKERSLPPAGVTFTENTFYNKKDSIIYKVYDDISGFTFSDNKVSPEVGQTLPEGFKKNLIKAQIDIARALTYYQNKGASWLSKKTASIPALMPVVNCKTAQEVYAALAKNKPVTIRLTSSEYTLDKPFAVQNSVSFTSSAKMPISFRTAQMPAVFIVMGNGNLQLKGLSINGDGIKATSLIASDNAGSSNHYSVALNGCTINNLGGECRALFYAHKSMVADSIVVRNSSFTGNSIDYIVMKEETDDKGYYNAEKIVLNNNAFTRSNGSLLNIYRGGNDESTLGPQLWVTANRFLNCSTTGNAPFIQLTGVQKTRFINNSFKDCYSGRNLFVYKDIVRADHLLEKNIFESSGAIQSNDYVTAKENLVK